MVSISKPCDCFFYYCYPVNVLNPFKIRYLSLYKPLFLCKLSAMIGVYNGYSIVYRTLIINKLFVS